MRFGLYVLSVYIIFFVKFVILVLICVVFWLGIYVNLIEFLFVFFISYVVIFISLYFCEMGKIDLFVVIIFFDSGLIFSVFFSVCL